MMNYFLMGSGVALIAMGVLLVILSSHTQLYVAYDHQNSMFSEPFEKGAERVEFDLVAAGRSVGDHATKATLTVPANNLRVSMFTDSDGVIRPRFTTLAANHAP